MNATIDYQRFATSIAMSSASPPVTRVSKCGMFITYKEHTLSVVNWRNGLRKLADELTADLEELCLNQTFGLNVPNTTFDDWGNDIRGYSWTQNEDFLIDPRSLLAAMLGKPELKLAKLDAAGDLVFDTVSVWEFIHKCDAVNEKLALLAFFTAGQTPRVSEFIEHKYANSTRPRTMFRDFKSLWLATRRVKNESRKQKETFLPMKCHPELTKLFERYLLIVRPVEAELVKVLHGDEHYLIYKEYLWTKAGSRLKPQQMRNTIQKFNSTYCGVAAGTKDYRQLCVQMGRTFLGSEFEIKEEEMDALASQAGHTITMTRLRYAPEVGALPSMSSDLLLRYGRVSEMWWEHAGFKPNTPPLLPLHVRQQLRDAAPPITYAPITGGVDIQPTIVDTQAIILAVTSALIAQVQKIDSSLDTHVRRAIAEALVEVQNLNIRLPPPPPAASDEAPMDQDSSFPPSAVQEPMTDIYGEPEMPIATQPSVAYTRHAFPSMRHDPLSASVPEAVSDDTLNALLRLHFPAISNPTFKSPQQKEAVRLAVEHQRSFVAVLPTGGGKSLTYTLPAFNPKEDGYHSYIIVPSRALLEDQVDHARRLGISTKWWAATNRAINDERLIYTAMESAGSNAFKEQVFICRLSFPMI